MLSLSRVYTLVHYITMLPAEWSIPTSHDYDEDAMESIYIYDVFWSGKIKALWGENIAHLCIMGIKGHFVTSITITASYLY